MRTGRPGAAAKASPKKAKPGKGSSALTGGVPARVATTDAGVNEDNLRAVVGARLKQSRLAAGMTARDLAATAGVTPGFISQVENGHVAPSIGTLLKLTTALGIRVGDLFDVAEVPGRLVRKDQRVLYRFPDVGFQEALLSADTSGNLEVIWCRALPGATTGDELFTHGSVAECVLVLEGEFEVLVAGDSYTLAAGDALTFAGELPHGCRNTSGKPAVLIWITTPASY